MEQEKVLRVIENVDMPRGVLLIDLRMLHDVLQSHPRRAAAATHEWVHHQQHVQLQSLQLRR